MKRKDILNAMKLIINATDRSESVLIGTDSFIFTNHRISTFNDEMSFSYPLETKLNCSIKAADTMKVIEKMKGEDIVFKQKDNAVTINDGSTKLKMRTLDGDEEIRSRLESMNLESAEWQDLPEDFMTGIRLCYYSAAQDTSIPELSSVMFDDDCFWASDNVRVSRYSLSKPIYAQFALPLSSIKMLMRLSEKLIRFTHASEWAHFETESGVIFSTAPLDKQYRQFPLDRIKNKLYKDFGPKTEEKDNKFKKLYEWPESLSDSIDAVGVMATAHEDLVVPNIKILRKGDYLILKGKKNYGKAKSRVKIEGEMFDEGIVVRIAPDFLKNIMSLTRSFSIYEGGVIKFETDKFWHIMSILLEYEEPNNS